MAKPTEGGILRARFNLKKAEADKVAAIVAYNAVADKYRELKANYVTHGESALYQHRELEALRELCDKLLIDANHAINTYSHCAAELEALNNG